jgi:molybdopterin synthase catalytic subunit
MEAVHYLYRVIKRIWDRLKSRKPLWKEEFLRQPFSICDYWKTAWQDVDTR